MSPVFYHPFVLSFYAPNSLIKAATPWKKKWEEIAANGTKPDTKKGGEEKSMNSGVGY